MRSPFQLENPEAPQPEKSTGLPGMRANQQAAREQKESRGRLRSCDGYEKDERNKLSSFKYINTSCICNQN